MKSMIVVLHMVLLTISNTNNTRGNLGKTSTSNDNRTEKDSVVEFKISAAKQNLPLDFDDNNSITLKNSIHLKAAQTDDENYSLKITHNKKNIFFTRSIKGVSKVLADADKLFFAVFNYSDEDGNNEGYAYIINLKNDTVLKYPVKLKNTANPVFYKDSYYFLDDGKLIETTSDLKETSTINIRYADHIQHYKYLDTYSVNGLSRSLNKDYLQIIFTPDKVKHMPHTYEGRISTGIKIINLIDAKS